ASGRPGDGPAAPARGGRPHRPTRSDPRPRPGRHLPARRLPPPPPPPPPPRALTCQLAPFHAPDAPRILAACPATARPAWRWLDRLPHRRDPDAPADRPHLVAVLDMTGPPPRAGPAGEGVLERAAAGGATVIWLASDTAGEPSELSMRVRVDDQGWATLQETSRGGRLVTGIRADRAALALGQTPARGPAPLRLRRPRAGAPRPRPG